jgi:UDP-glucose 4-epimerase
MAICLVAGGAGFIGSHLVEALVARGNQVRVIDNFSTGLLSNLENVRHDIEIIFGDLNQSDVLGQATQGIELFFQFAMPSHDTQDTPESAAHWAQPSECLQCLVAACAAKVRRLIYASSCSVYGQNAASPLTEDDWALPDTGAGFAKLAGELQCIGFTALYGLETVRLRLSHTFGPRQGPPNPHAQEVLAIVKTMLAGHSPVLDRAARTARDFVHVDDVVHAALLAADAPRVSGQVYNIARGQSATLLDVVAAVNQLRGTNIKPIWQERECRIGDEPSIAIGRAEADLGFCPSIDLQQGLLALIEHHERHTGRETVAHSPACGRSQLPGPLAPSAMMAANRLPKK